MKRRFVGFIILALLLLPDVSAFSCGRYSYPYYRDCRGDCDSSVYLVGNDVVENTINFKDCDKHAVGQTRINYYSNGTSSAYTYYTVYDANGVAIAVNCTDVIHIIDKGAHYFLLRINGKYGIYSDVGVLLSRKYYSKMSEIAPGKLLVQSGKMYGIIDVRENVIVPIKYNNLSNLGSGLFIAKLHGYFGIIDINGNTIYPCEYDKISRLYDTFLLKKYGKYGLATIDAQPIIEAKYDKIKSYGEYILVKSGKLYGVFDQYGNQISDIKYTKIRLNRNHLEGKIGYNWIRIGEDQ